MSLPRPSRPTALVGLGLVATLALGACSSGASGTSGASGVSDARAIAPVAADPAAPADGEAAAPDASTAQDQKAGAPAAAGSAAKANPATPSDLAAADKLVRTASMQVQVDDVEARAADVRSIAVAAGGMVTSENSTATPRGVSDGTVDKEGSRSVLAIAVPADTLDRVLDELGKLGTTVQRTSSSRDVTTSYVDTQARISTMKASLDQLRALLAKTTALDQVISLETELSRRQADLDSLQAQLNALDKKVAMSSLTVTLATAAQVVIQEDDGTGFLGGLRHGWRAFLMTFGGVLTVLGAVLPFLVLVALVGTPVYVWRRRRVAERRRQAQELMARSSSGPGSSNGDSGNGGGNGDGGGNGGNGNGGNGGPSGSGGSGYSEGPGGSEGPGDEGGHESGPDGAGQPEGTSQHQPEPAGAR